MGKDVIHQLPAYPSTQARKSFSASQLASLNQTISSSLQQIIAIPPSKRDSFSAFTFVTSYAKDRAFQDLEALIWKKTELGREDKLIRKQTLILAESIASSAPGFQIDTLLDLAIVYASTNLSRIKSILASALTLTPGLVQLVADDLIPVLIHLLDASRGLYAIRKASHCITSFLYSSSPEIVRCFVHSKAFVLALGTLYDSGLTSIANSYGGLSALRNHNSGAVDEWELIWVQTKVDLIDAFHAIMSTLLSDIASSSGESLATESDYAFDIIFALHDIPSPSSSSETQMPYLDQSLLLDYHESYSLSKTLASALRHSAEKDARLDLLESLQSFKSSARGSSSKSKDAGVLKILLRSSGMPSKVDTTGAGSSSMTSDFTKIDKGKGKEKAPSPGTTHIPDIDIKITQVLDILPEHPAQYIRLLLEHRTYEGSSEKVIEALLEGTAPTAKELGSKQSQGRQTTGDDFDDVLEYVKDRKNVFDDEVMDPSRMRIGKNQQDASMLLRDRSFIERMKADILRRAEEMDDDDDDGGETQDNARKDQDVILAFDEDDALAATVKVEGDGEKSDESDGGGEPKEQPKPLNPETVLELAYIRDPKLFDRDAQTRRGKARSDLKTQTGWGDEQIEGWKIMLERNPHKDKILQKHEFSGNRNTVAGDSEALGPSNSHIGPGGRDGGRGSRGGETRGRGRGRGGGGRGGGGEHSDGARSRASKERRGNQNRKRGHDKKMARIAPGPSV